MAMFGSSRLSSLSLFTQKVDVSYLGRNSIFIFFFVIVSILFSSNRAIATISQTQREALIALYNSTDGDNWTNNDGWKTHAPKPKNILSNRLWEEGLTPPKKNKAELLDERNRQALKDF